MESPRVTMRLDRKLLKKLKADAKENDVPLTAVIKATLNLYYEKVEK